MTSRSLRTAALLGAALFSSALATAAYAGGPYSGTVTGTFSNPVVTGGIVDLDGTLTSMNNLGSAVTSFADGGSVLSWGDQDPSSLTFVESPFSNVAPGDTFHLGTLIYHNGTSSLGTLIFGAQLTLSTDGVTDNHLTDINIVTTNNTGLSAARDSDFIGFSDFSSTFNVVEGGTSSIELFGTIVGDPQLTFDSIQLSAGATGGFVGDGIGGVPEPAAWTLMLLGFFGLGSALRARRRTAARAAA